MKDEAELGALLLEDDLEQAADVETQEALMKKWFAPDGLLEFVWGAPVKTVDEHDQEQPIKPLPRLDFLELYYKLLMKERWINVAKSRQVFMTWATFVYMVWRVLQAPQMHVAYVPKKKEDGERHLNDRIKGAIWQHLPEWLKARFFVAPVKGLFLVTHRLESNGKPTPWDSWIVCYPQGADQLRSYTHSVVVGDEVAHQPKHKEWWMAAVPTIQERGGKRGQIVQLSSAKRGSFFADQLGPRLYEAVKMARGAA